MNLNYQKARNLMVENQLRPNKIKDKLILNLFKEMPKEDFLIDVKSASPYSDLDIDLTPHRGYLKNLHIAQLINGAEIAPIPNISIILTAHHGIKPPIGTRPSMSIIPATKSSVASKLRIRNAL